MVSFFFADHRGSSLLWESRWLGAVGMKESKRREGKLLLPDRPLRWCEPCGYGRDGDAHSLPEIGLAKGNHQPFLDPSLSLRTIGMLCFIFLVLCSIERHQTVDRAFCNDVSCCFLVFNLRTWSPLRPAAPL